MHVKFFFIYARVGIGLVGLIVLFVDFVLWCVANSWLLANSNNLQLDDRSGEKYCDKSLFMTTKAIVIASDVLGCSIAVFIIGSFIYIKSP